jgi:hypothetical protein
VQEADHEPPATAGVIAMLGTVEHAVLTVVAKLLHALEYFHVLGEVNSRRRRLLDHRRTGPEDLEELNLLLEQVPLATRVPLLLSLAAGKLVREPALER